MFKTISTNSYYRNLDSLRFLAAFSVIVFHWMPERIGSLPLGKIGVDFFFVLSGFLITEILLIAKSTSEKSNSGKISAVKKFYFKRALRIFPAYYLIVLFFFILKIPDLGNRWIYIFTYTSNFDIYFQTKWMSFLSPVWSLAVEEQFYIIWPFVILFINRRWVMPIILITIILSLFYISFSFVYSQERYYPVLLISCMSTLAIGGMAAYLKNAFPEKFFSFSNFYLLLLMGLIPVFLYNLQSLNYIIQHILIALISFLLIAYSVVSKNKLYNSLLSNPVTSYLGKISYGIYLLHDPIPWLVRNFNHTETDTVLNVPRLLPAFKKGFFVFSENLVILIILASFSWWVIERPILSLKSKIS